MRSGRSGRPADAPGTDRVRALLGSVGTSPTGLPQSARVLDLLRQKERDDVAVLFELAALTSRQPCRLTQLARQVSQATKCRSVRSAEFGQLCATCHCWFAVCDRERRDHAVPVPGPVWETARMSANLEGP